MRPSLLGSIDRPFASTLAAFLAIELTGAVALAQRPVIPSETLELATLPERRAHPLVPLVPPPRAVPPKPVAGPVQRAAAPLPVPSPAAPPRDLQEVVRHSGTFAVLAARRADLTRAIADAIGPTSASRELEAAIHDAHGRLESGDNAPRERKDLGPLIAESAALQTAGGEASVAGPAHTSSAPRSARVDLDPQSPPLVQGGDAEMIAAFLRSHARALSQCYEHELKLNATLHGRMVVRFIVTPAGRIAEPEVVEDELGSEALGLCLVRNISRWQLTVRPTEEVPVSFPLVFAPAAG